MIRHIGDSVRTLREREGLSVGELALRCGVPAPVLAALERGEPAITTTQLAAVAMALAVEPAGLLRGSIVPAPVPSVFLRHTSYQDFGEADGLVLDDALEQGRGLVRMVSLLAEPVGALQAGVFQRREAATHRTDAPAQDGYQLAQEFRVWLGAGTAPIGDLRDLVEARIGVAVAVSELDSARVTAAAVRADDAGAIVLSASDPYRSKNPLLARVHLAHELCHLLFDPSPGGLHIVVDETGSRRAHAAEQRARAFAAEVLLPLDGLTRILGTPQNVTDPASANALVGKARSTFGTPHELTANHLCNRGFIDIALRSWLEAERTTFAGDPPRTTLPEKGAPSRLLSALVERAHREGHLADVEARCLLRLDVLAPLPWDQVEL